MSGCDIQVSNEQEIVAIDEQQLHDTAAYVLAQLGVKTAALSIAVVDDEAIAELKGRYFGEPVVTDVISFDLGGSDGSDGACDQECATVDCIDQERVTIDCEVVVNAQRAAEVGGSQPGGALAELNLYVVHGLLHQLGYDDQTPDEAEAMHKKEDELLVELGFGKVYCPQPPE